MIVGVSSLEEAIDYVQDPDIKEELTYQYRKIIPRLEAFKEIAVLEYNLEESSYEIDSLRDDCERLEDRVSELEDIEEKFNLIKDKLFSCQDEISIQNAEDYLNEILFILNERPIKILK